VNARLFAIGLLQAILPVLLGSCTRAPSPANALDRETAAWRARLDLARSDAFHLVLDAQDRTLDLRLRGALLRRFPVLEIRRPVRRVAFIEREEDDAFLYQVFHDGRLEPERPSDRYEVVVNPGDPDSEAPPPRVPPPPEEAIPAPGRYRIRFAEGFVIEVRAAPEAADSATAPDGGRLAAIRQALGLDPFHAMQLSLAMPAAEAAALYRALPPGVHLVVAP